jgi:isopentenyl-diphosphate delta-isomerase
MGNKLHDLNGEKRDQMLQLTDKKGGVIGAATREDCHSGAGKTHLAFMAILINKDGELILAKRSRKKSLWANFWDASVVSHVLPGETVIEATKRRSREELGVEADFTDVGAFIYQVKHGLSSENEFCHVLIGRTSNSIDPNPIEVSEIKIISKNHLKKKLISEPDKYTPWLKIAVKKNLI